MPLPTRHRHRARRVPLRILLLCGVALVVGTAIALTLLVVPHEPTTAAWGAERTVARDGFDRADDARGWGAPDAGGEWSSSDPGDLRIIRDTGVLALGPDAGSVSSRISGVAVRDVALSGVAAIPDRPTHRRIEAELVARGSETGDGIGSGYAARLSVAADGDLALTVVRHSGGRTTTLGGPVTIARASVPGQRVRVDFEVTGSRPVQLRAGARLDGASAGPKRIDVRDAGPLRLSDAGAVGVAGVVPSGVSTEVAWYSFGATALEGVASQSTGGGRAADTAGAHRPGTRDFGVPTGALVVATDGRPGARGTAADPFGSIADAVAAAPDGGTVVVRGGVYPESIVIPAGRRLTLQPYGREAVWLEGSDVVEGWEREGADWVHPGWTSRFDASPTYTRGGSDGSGAFSFVGPQNTFAAHPDQLWFDGAPLRQVSPEGTVGPGEFAVDEAGDRLVAGSDPSGAEVRASARVRAVTVIGAGSVIQGIGVRRYSPSVPDLGAVLVAGPRVTVRDVTVADSATTGLSVISDHGTVDHVTTIRSGMLGMHANYADHLIVESLLTADNNTERFNRAPVSGGLKITRSRHVEVRDSAALRNAGNGIWFDESVYDAHVIDNDIRDSSGNALVVELSADFVVAGNLVTGNGGVGIWISDSGHGSIWNNTVAGSDRALNLTQGTRRASDLSVPGHDPRRPKPDPTVTWVLEDVRIANNVLADSTGNCVLCVEDHSHERSADRMRLRIDGDLFQRGRSDDPTWLVVWSRGAGDPAVYRRLGDFIADTGQESQSLEIDGRPVLGPSNRVLDAVVANEGRFAQPLPSSIARETGQSSGARVWGASGR